MKSRLAALAAVSVLALSGTAVAQEEGPDTFPLDDLPAADAAELNRLAALPDAALLEQLFGGAPPGRSPVLERFSPPGLTLRYPVSHGYAGPRDACLRYRVPAACRLHLEDLMTIQLRRQPGAGSGANPFGRPR